MIMVKFRLEMVLLLLAAISAYGEGARERKHWLGYDDDSTPDDDESHPAHTTTGCASVANAGASARVTCQGSVSSTRVSHCADGYFHVQGRLSKADQCVPCNIAGCKRCSLKLNDLRPRQDVDNVAVEGDLLVEPPCSATWSSSESGGSCGTTQSGCPDAACDDDELGSWCKVDNETYASPDLNVAEASNYGSERTGWKYCKPKEPSCLTEWSTYNDGDACKETQSGCPSAACDGGEFKPWCKVGYWDGDSEREYDGEWMNPDPTVAAAAVKVNQNFLLEWKWCVPDADGTNVGAHLSAAGLAPTCDDELEPPPVTPPPKKVQPYVFYVAGGGSQVADMVTNSASTAAAIAAWKRVGISGFRAVGLIIRLLKDDLGNARYQALLDELCPSQSAAKPSNCPTIN